MSKDKLDDVALLAQALRAEARLVLFSRVVLWGVWGACIVSFLWQGTGSELARLEQAFLILTVPAGWALLSAVLAQFLVALLLAVSLRAAFWLYFIGFLCFGIVAVWNSGVAIFPLGLMTIAAASFAAATKSRSWWSMKGKPLSAVFLLAGVPLGDRILHANTIRWVAASMMLGVAYYLLTCLALTFISGRFSNGIALPWAISIAATFWFAGLTLRTVGTMGSKIARVPALPVEMGRLDNPRALFLRPFARDAVYPAASLLELCLFGIPEPREWDRLSLQAFPLGTEMVAIGNAGSYPDLTSAQQIYSGTLSWKKVVKSFADQASIIVLVVGESVGVEWEREMINSSPELREKTIWIHLHRAGNGAGKSKCEILSNGKVIGWDFDSRSPFAWQAAMRKASSVLAP